MTLFYALSNDIDTLNESVNFVTNAQTVLEGTFTADADNSASYNRNLF